MKINDCHYGGTYAQIYSFQSRRSRLHNDYVPGIRGMRKFRHKI